jgi:hypothetical protein
MAADKEHRAVIEEFRLCNPCAVIFTSCPIAGSLDRACAPGISVNTIFLLDHGALLFLMFYFASSLSGILAGLWQSSLMSSPVTSRCRQLIQANLPAALEKAKHELSAYVTPGVICVSGSLHAVAQATRHFNC